MTIEQLSNRPLSYSSIKEFAKSPSHYIKYLTKDRKDTPELIFGSALHCVLLTPGSFNDQFIVTDKFDLRKKEDKAKYELVMLEAAAGNKKVLQSDVHDTLIEITNKVLENDEFVQILDMAHTIEQKEYLEIFGLPFIRIKDIETDDAIIDIKSTQDASIESMNKDFFNYQYYLQAAIYGNNFKFYVVEKNFPYYNGLIDVSKDWIEYGTNKLERLCIAFNHCLENPECFNQSYDFWYKFENRKPIISLPGWAK